LSLTFKKVNWGQALAEVALIMTSILVAILINAWWDERGEREDRSLMADAYLMFKLSENGQIQTLDMKNFDPRTDFSFDFHHLNLKPKPTKDQKISD
jgi:hypothetical protein